MLLGYTFILLAAICWGASGVIAKHWALTGFADAMLLSQTRVTFSWLVVLAALASSASRRRLLRVRGSDLIRFFFLGVIGMAGANFFLYYAIGLMNVAVADLIQFTAPVMVAAYLAVRGAERLDRAKAAALVLSLTGCALALNFTGTTGVFPPVAIASAIASAVCFAFLIVYGKGLTAQYSLWTYLHYALLAATIFWCLVNPPHQLVHRLADPAAAGRLIGFALLSILVPYVFFFSGLRRVPASRAAIVSTFEPVVMAVGSWLALGDPLRPVQVAGVALVVVAIALVELTSPQADGGLEESLCPDAKV